VLVEHWIAPVHVNLRFDVGCGDIEVPNELKALACHGLRLHTSAELLIVSNWIKVIDDNDFRCCLSLRNVIVDRVSQLKEIHGFQCCPSLESIEIHGPIEVIGNNAFTHLVRTDGPPHNVRNWLCRRTIFLIVTDEEWLRRVRRQGHVLMHGRMSQARRDFDRARDSNWQLDGLFFW
jgi:hypothetical protein